MLPAYAAVAVIVAREKFKHATRKRPGDPKKRTECCDPLPAEYPERSKVTDISELSPKLDHVSTINMGYTR